MAPALTRVLLPSVATVPAAYVAIAEWEDYAAPTYCRSRCTRHLTLLVEPGAKVGERVLELRTNVVELRQEADDQLLPLEPVEVWAQRLAALYAVLRVRVAANGAWVEVLNQAAIAQTWAALRAELLAEGMPDEPLLASLLAAVDRQVADPAAVLRSLRYDYLYQVLAGGWPAPPPPPPLVPDADGWSGGQARCFAAFLPGTDLWFREQASAGPATATGTRWLAVRGLLEAARTDWSAALPQLLAADGPPQAGYQARVEWDVAAGLPAWLELTVHVRQASVFNKQYTLTLARA